MKKELLLLASVMAVSSMTVIPAAADEERPTIFFLTRTLVSKHLMIVLPRN